MDPALLIREEFWRDRTPLATRALPQIPELENHVLFETSGSSGTPKWVALSKPALLSSAAAVNAHLRATPESCWGLALPLHHVGGFGVAARAYQAGCRLASFPDKWSAAQFQAWLETAGVTHTSLVPTQVHDLVKAKLTPPLSLQAIVVGGGRLDPSTGQAARELGWPVLASYGMTEAGSQIATQGLEALRFPYQVAPIPLLPHWQARLSTEGLLEVSGPALFSGYLVGGEFRPRAGDWHTTSDRVSLDDHGLTPLGRADTRIKVLGELVDPEQIEWELIGHSDGQLRAGSLVVIAVPDPRAQNLLVPVFERSSADEKAVELAIAAYQKSAPGFRRLAEPRWLDEFPRTELGKLRRGEIAAMIF